MIGISATVEKETDTEGVVTDAVREALLDAADVGFDKSQERVAQNSTDTGQLLRSGVQPEQRQDGSIVWGYTAPYARAVEFGSAPHFPPIEPLKGWARRVLGDESAAYAVQQKIGKEGTQPQPFVRPGIEAMRRRLRAKGIAARLEDNLDL